MQASRSTRWGEHAPGDDGVPNMTLDCSGCERVGLLCGRVRALTRRRLAMNGSCTSFNIVMKGVVHKIEGMQ